MKNYKKKITIIAAMIVISTISIYGSAQIDSNYKNNSSIQNNNVEVTYPDIQVSSNIESSSNIQSSSVATSSATVQSSNPSTASSSGYSNDYYNERNILNQEDNNLDYRENKIEQQLEQLENQLKSNSINWQQYDSKVLSLISELASIEQQQELVDAKKDALLIKYSMRSYNDTPKTPSFETIKNSQNFLNEMQPLINQIKDFKYQKEIIEHKEDKIDYDYIKGTITKNEKNRLENQLEIEENKIDTNEDNIENKMKSIKTKYFRF